MTETRAEVAFQDLTGIEALWQPPKDAQTMYRIPLDRELILLGWCTKWAHLDKIGHDFDATREKCSQCNAIDAYKAVVGDFLFMSQDYLEPALTMFPTTFENFYKEGRELDWCDMGMAEGWNRAVAGGWIVPVSEETNDGNALANPL